MNGPMERELLAWAEKMQLDEASMKFAQVIDRLTSKGKKYVTYKAVQNEMGQDDETFGETLKSAMKANKHSNKYIFTHDGEEPSVGITAAKRRTTANTTPSSDPGYGMAHGKGSGTGDMLLASQRVTEHRENELWKIIKENGWRGLDRLDLLPEGWQNMSDKVIVESIIAKEFLTGLDLGKVESL